VVFPPASIECIGVDSIHLQKSIAQALPAAVRHGHGRDLAEPHILPAPETA
jgi:hypothetical protein